MKCVLRAVVATLRYVRALCFLALDSIGCFGLRRSGDVALTLRLDAIGDFFIWLQSGAVDVAQYVRERRHRNVLLANASWAEYARSLHIWDEVIDVEPIRFVRNPIYRIVLMRRIRKLGAKLLIQPRAARVLLQEDSIARVSGAYRIGNAGTSLNTEAIWRKLSDKSYDALIEVNQERSVHEIVRNDDFVRGLTGESSSRHPFTRGQDVNADGPIVVALGAGWSGRIWPTHKLTSLLQQIRSTYPGLRFQLVGMYKERQAADAVASMLGGNVDNRVGCTNLSGLVNAISAARLVICNDSAAYHIAMANDRPVLCFLGGGHYGSFAPYPAELSTKARVLSVRMECYWCNWRCKYPYTKSGAVVCVDSITVEAACEAVDQLLAAFGPSKSVSGSTP